MLYHFHQLKKTHISVPVIPIYGSNLQIQPLHPFLYRRRYLITARVYLTNRLDGWLARGAANFSRAYCKCVQNMDNIDNCA